MENANRIESYVRRAGVVVGIALVALVVVAFRVPGGSGALGADVIVAIAPTGELGVSRPGPFLTVTGLRPGADERSSVTVHNQTDKTLLVGLRALPDSRDLDDVLRLEVRAGDKTLFRGPLGRLRKGVSLGTFGSGDRRRLEVRTSLPASLRGGYAGRIETVSLRLRSRVLGGAAR
jgi:hypothetical protein